MSVPKYLIISLYLSNIFNNSIFATDKKWACCHRPTDALDEVAFVNILEYYIHCHVSLQRQYCNFFTTKQGRKCTAGLNEGVLIPDSSYRGKKGNANESYVLRGKQINKKLSHPSSILDFFLFNSHPSLWRTNVRLINATKKCLKRGEIMWVRWFCLLFRAVPQKCGSYYILSWEKMDELVAYFYHRCALVGGERGPPPLHSKFIK